MTKFRMKKEIGGQPVGAHTVTIDGRKTVLRPGDVVECDAAQIAGAAWKFDLVEAEKPAPQESPPQHGNLELRERGEPPGTYDVIMAASGKALNSKPLTKEEAERLITDPPSGAETSPEPSQGEGEPRGR